MFLVNLSQLPPFFLFFTKEKRDSIFSAMYYDDEESNYHYIDSIFYFIFQVHDNPNGLWIFLSVGALPSPSSCGLSIGFITTLITTWHLLNQHLFWLYPNFSVYMVVIVRVHGVGWELGRTSNIFLWVWIIN